MPAGVSSFVQQALPMMDGMFGEGGLQMNRPLRDMIPEEQREGDEGVISEALMELTLQEFLAIMMGNFGALRGVHPRIRTVIL